MTLAANFPDGSGYVLAAYLVFLALLLIYLGVTAYRLLGLERRLTQVTEQLDRAEGRGGGGGGGGADRGPAAVPADPADREKDGVA